MSLFSGPIQRGKRIRTSKSGTTPSANAPCFERLEERLAPASSELWLPGLSDLGGNDPATTLGVLLVSRNVPHAQAIGAAGRTDAIVIEYDPLEMNTQRLVEVLAATSAEHGSAPIGHLGLVAHGEAGRLALGAGDVWSLERAGELAPSWRKLAGYLSDDARIDLFACDVAQGPGGLELVDQLAYWTQADVFASTNAVGNDEGADFVWEYTTGVDDGARELLDLAALAALPQFSLVGDWAESNDTLSAAVYLGRGGALDWSGLSIHNSTDQDWFKFTIDEPGTAGQWVAIYFDHANGDLDMVLYDASGNFVGSSQGSVNNESISLAGLAAGSYFLNVYGFLGAQNGYNFQVRAGNLVGVGDFIEPNNSPSQAYRIPSNASSFFMFGMTIHDSSDEDWFRFNLADEATSSHYLQISQWDTGVANLDIAIYDENTALIDFTSGSSDTEILSLDGLGRGTYYFAVYGNVLANSGYRLDMSVPAAPSNDYAEPNDGFAFAKDLGTLTNTIVLEDLVIASGDVDCFRFTLPNTGSTADSVRIDFAHSEGDLDMILFDGSEQFVDSSAGVTDSETIDLAGLPAGTYFVQVHGFSGSTGRYRLTLNGRGTLASDAFESNDSLGTAANLGTIQGLQTFANLSIHAANNDDWYKFTTAGIGSASNYVQLDFQHSLGDVDVELYDANGVWLRSSTGVDDVERIPLDGLTAGTYLVRVYGYSGATNPNYTVSIDAPRTTTSDPFEPNQTLGAARNLGTIRGTAAWQNLSIHQSGDEDWFLFGINAAGENGHYVRTDFLHSLGDVDIELYNAAGQLLASSTSTSDFEQISLGNRAAGSYYLRVYGYSGAVNPNYALSIVAPTGTSIPGDRLEPNNNAGSATQVRSSNSANLTGTQTIENLTIHSSTDVDFFVFTTVATGTSAHGVRLQFNHGNGDLDVELLNASQTVIASSTGTTDNEYLSLQGLAAGTYYVRVYGFAGAMNAYRLTFDTPVSATPSQNLDAWTILVYITASDLHRPAFDDVNEMEIAASQLPGSVNLAVYWDQSSALTTYPTGRGSQAAWGTVGRAIVSGDTNRNQVATVFDVLAEQNSGHPDTLRNFIDWAAVAAPAQQYALILWDHGSGLHGFNYDNSDGTGSDNLTTTELVTALTAASTRMNLVSFDACLMAMTEIGYTLRNLTDVFAGSQELEPGSGHDYTTLFTSLLTNPHAVSAEGLASGFVQSYQAQYVGRTNNDTYSAVRSSQFNSLASALNAFVTSTGSASAGDWTALRNARDAAIGYNFAYLRDLGSFLRTIAGNSAITTAIRNAATGVINALAAAVITKTADVRSSSGLSVYLPAIGSSVGSWYGEYSAFVGATGWNSFLANLVSSSAPRSAFAQDWSESNDSAAVAYNLRDVSGTTNYTSLSLHAPGDADFFRFTIGAAGTSTNGVTVTPADLANVLVLQLLDSTGATVLQQSGPGAGARTVSLSGRAAGTYYVRVAGNGSAVVPEYALSINAPGSGAEGWTGDNRASDKAYPLGSITPERKFPTTTISANTEEWYTFETPRLDKPQPARVYVDIGGSVAVTVRLYNGAGQQISSAVGTGRLTLRYTAPRLSETFRLRLSAPAGAGQVSYSLTFSPADETDRVGAFRGGLWYLDANNNRNWDTGPDVTFPFGLAGDVPVVGDWNGDGFDDIGVFRNGTWFIDSNGSRAWETGVDAFFNFGLTGDRMLVGDWNGDHFDDWGVFRNGQWFLDTNRNGVWNPGSDVFFTFGSPGDVPVIGDFNGDGFDDWGVFRNGQWFLDTNRNGVWNPGSDVFFTFGSPGDVPVVKDFNGDGFADWGVFRNGIWYVDANRNGTWEAGADVFFPFGLGTDVPVGGRWTTRLGGTGATTGSPASGTIAAGAAATPAANGSSLTPTVASLLPIGNSTVAAAPSLATQPAESGSTAAVDETVVLRFDHQGSDVQEIVETVRRRAVQARDAVFADDQLFDWLGG